MRSIAIALLLCAPGLAQSLTMTGPGAAASASAGIARIGTNNCIGNVAGGTSSGTTSAVTTTGAKLIVLVVAGSPGSMSVSDSKSNTYTQLTPQDELSALDGIQFYVLNPTVGSGHTFTINGVFSSMCELAFSGVTAFDKEGGAPAVGSVATLQPGSLTPAVANSLFITACSLNTSSTVTAGDLGAGFTQAGFLDFTSGQYYGVCVAYAIQVGGPTALNPTWGATNTALATATMAIFKP